MCRVRVGPRWLDTTLPCSPPPLSRQATMRSSAALLVLLLHGSGALQLRTSKRASARARGKKRTATDAMGAINTARTRRGVETTSLSTVSRYCQGLTHRRDCL